MKLPGNFPYIGLAYRFPSLYGKMLQQGFPYDFSHAELSDMVPLGSLTPGSVVLDLCCGIGDFTFWIAERRTDVHVIGIDNAPAMLEGAIRTADEKGTRNVSFVCKDITELKKEDLPLPGKSAVEPARAEIAMIVSYLGFSAMENYAEAFRHTLPLLSEGGTYLISDVSREPGVVNRVANFFVENILAGADSFRRCYEPLRETLAEFQIYRKTIPDDIFPFPFATASPYIARGIRKPAI
uniref:Ubiquinone/menaquinone biosynthesis C-methylase UbiE n=1 Tax=Candidatus Kentrum sp. FW TaxID=2126338 RepID=A0A450S8L6_9GAMM|nr:MAG: Ubiquinone/menaquinone biosynthesis C-methylase UbiE [Candidatus Kentron sp. FW]VFJ53529.1 MAG: Ubiquinone/menaquinone biosynthesis C-methylase UbiE [Candidatus Kentron sp. FW]